MLPNFALFLGFPLTLSYHQELLQVFPEERELFIQDRESPYLQRIENKGILYLGKYLTSPIEIASLDPLSLHIYSILKKLVPHFPYAQHPLLLLAVPS